MFNGILSAIYPSLCYGCGNKLRGSEKLFCLHCEIGFSPFEQIDNPSNEIQQLFWGKCKVENAFAIFEFNKGEPLQNLIHEFKYNSKKDLGIVLGNLVGMKLINKSYLTDIDLIITVPMHKIKIKKRRYNQASILAKGISSATNIQVNETVLKRATQKSSQTSKTVYERANNMKNVFDLQSGINLDGKHILIVDDVITTGATICACIQKIHEKFNCKVSVIALAFRNI